MKSCDLDKLRNRISTKRKYKIQNFNPEAQMFSNPWSCFVQANENRDELLFLSDQNLTSPIPHYHQWPSNDHLPDNLPRLQNTTFAKIPFSSSYWSTYSKNQCNRWSAEKLQSLRLRWLIYFSIVKILGPIIDRRSSLLAPCGDIWVGPHCTPQTTGRRPKPFSKNMKQVAVV